MQELETFLDWDLVGPNPEKLTLAEAIFADNSPEVGVRFGNIRSPYDILRLKPGIY